MNVYGIGRVVKDIEVKDAGNSKVANFSLACSRDFKRDGQPDTDFIDCTAFGKTAEFLGQYAHKGQQVFVEQGRWQNDTFTDKEGKKRVAAKLMIDRVKLVGTKPNADDDEIPFA